MWSSARSLRCLVLDVLCNDKVNRLLELENALLKNHNLLLNPLKFPGKSSTDREALNKANRDAINLPDFPQKVSLTPDLVQEALFFSDFYDLNELLVVELLLTAESQLSMYPRFTRGLVAVLLYYDTHLSVVETLVTLMQAREGRMWSTTVSAEVNLVVQKCTSDLWTSGLLQNIIGSLKNFDVFCQFSRLESSHVLGDSRHKHDVFMILKKISDCLAECVMLWSCQTALTLVEAKLILDYLLSYKIVKPTSSNETDDLPATAYQFDGVMISPNVHLLMSLLYSFQPFSVNTSSADQISDLTNYDLMHPLFSDRAYAPGIGRLLDDQKLSLENRADGNSSEQVPMLGLVRLAWALCLRRTNHLRAEIRRRRVRGYQRSSEIDSDTDLQTVNDDDYGVTGDEDDEILAASAIESKALEFTRKQLLRVQGFEKQPLWVYRLHGIITDLIIHLPVRVREIRMRDEDSLRSNGIDPSTTGQGFANFLLLIAHLYNQPGSQLHARLALEYWWPVGDLAASTSGPVACTGDFLSTNLISRSPKVRLNTYGARPRNAELDNIRQAALFRFVRSAGDMVTTSCLFIPYLSMLHGLTGSRSSASLCYSLLKANVSNPGRAASLISWDHFFTSFRQYLIHMKQSVNQPSEISHSNIQASNQLYPHLYLSNGPISSRFRAPTTRWTQDSTNVGLRRGPGMSDLGTGVPVTSQLRAIQPEEQAGLRVVLQLVSRIARLDPVARSSFVSTNQWQVIQLCLGFLTCPVSLELKADVVNVLTDLARSQQIAILLWRHLTSAELLPFCTQRLPGQSQPIQGIHTDMDEVEPRAEQYPLTNSFLNFMTILLPKLTHYPSFGNSSKPVESKDTVIFSSDGSSTQSNIFVSILSFITNSIFLRHTMRAYRDPNERWNIASSCLVLFDGLVNDFLNRLNNAMCAVITLMSSNQEQKEMQIMNPLFNQDSWTIDSQSTNCSFDWASYLLNILTQLDKDYQLCGGFRPTSIPEALINQLRLPSGWPYTDPGYHLAAQLLTDSSLFRMVTGLLEVGLHRHLQFPIPNGPPVGMTRATLAGLNLIHRLLASEDILVTFVRRVATSLQPRLGPKQTTPSSTVSIPLPSLPSFGHTVLPVCLSRLLMSINSGSGRADLIPMLLKYCMLADYLPDHTACVVNIMGYLAGSIKPHSDFLALLTADLDTRRQLLSTFASLLKWPINSGRVDLSLYMGKSDNLANLDNEGFFTFTDEWLLGTNPDSEDIQLRTVGIPSNCTPHPAFQVAKMDAAFPFQTPDWYFPSHEWEHWTAWPYSHFQSAMDVRTDYNRLTNGSYYSVAFGNWLYQVMIYGHSTPPSISLLHILLAGLDHPAPNLTHWLCGFRIDNYQAISRSTLQDAGIGDQPRTCLHSLLDIIDTASRFAQSTSFVPYESALTIHWNLALIWQILYRLAASPLTTGPLLRFLRSNLDLLAKHLQFDLCRYSIFSHDDGLVADEPSVGSLSRKQHSILEALSLNQKNWLLRILAIEIRAGVLASQRSYVSRLLRLFIGDLLFDNSQLISDQASSSLLASFLQLLNVSEDLSDPGNLELKLLDPGLIEQLLKKSEVGCCLLASDSSTIQKVSAMINSKTFLTNLCMRLITFRKDLNLSSDENLMNVLLSTIDQTNSFSESENLKLLLQDVTRINQWVDARNTYRLQLYIGKQAALESWRQVVEISLGILIKENQIGNMLQINQIGSSISLIDSDFGTSVLGGNGNLGKRLQSRPLPVVCLDVLILLLTEVCAPDSTPHTIRLLASGTGLSLCSFLHSQSYAMLIKFVTSDTGNMAKPIFNKQWIPLLVSSVEFLIKSIINTKSSAQRIRANYYGSLCYILKFCKNIKQRLQKDDQLSNDLSLLLSDFASLFNPNPSCFTSRSDNINSTDLTNLYNLLVTDLVHGHAVTQMSSISLLNLILSLDRNSNHLINYLDSQEALQHIVDTVIEELKTMNTYFTTSNDQFLNENDCSQISTQQNLQTNAVSAFHLYQAKLSLLCCIGSFTNGAKILANHEVMNRLAGCEFFSFSNLATCYSFGLDSLYVCDDQRINYSVSSEDSRVGDLNWFRQSFCHSLILPTKDDETLFYGLMETILNEKSFDVVGNDETAITWASGLLPALRLFKIILNSLGPTHISANQQVFNFLYANSSSLLCNESELANALVTFLSRKDWSYMNPVLDKRNSNWLIQWLASETCLISLFGQTMQSYIAMTITQSLDEYSNLQREVIQSKILRHVFQLLPLLIDSNMDTNSSIKSKCQNSRIAFEHLLIQTQRAKLINNILFVLNSYVSTSANRNRKLDITTDTSSSRSLFQFFDSLTTGLQQQQDLNPNWKSGFPNGVLIFGNLLKWALNSLRHLEHICLKLVDCQFLTNRDKDTTHLEQGTNITDQQYGRSVLQLLCSEFSNERISLGELRQSASIIYDCPVHFFNSSTERVTGIDSQQLENQILQRFTRIGVVFFRIQIRSLIAIIEQSAYLIWKQLTDLIDNSDDDPNRRIRGPAWNSPSKMPRSFSRNKLEHHKDHPFILNDLCVSLRHMFNEEFFEWLNQLTNTAYLEQNQRLFIKVMNNRLSKLILRTINSNSTG